MRRKIDPTLMELCMGIAAYGIIFEIVLFFSPEIRITAQDFGSVSFWLWPEPSICGGL